MTSYATYVPTVDDLKELDLDSAKHTIVEAFNLGNIDANDAFRLAAEIGVTLTIS